MLGSPDILDYSRRSRLAYLDPLFVIAPGMRLLRALAVDRLAKLVWFISRYMPPVCLDILLLAESSF